MHGETVKLTGKLIFFRAINYTYFENHTKQKYYYATWTKQGVVDYPH